MSHESWHPNEVFDGLGNAASLNFLREYKGRGHTFKAVSERFLDFSGFVDKIGRIEDFYGQAQEVMSRLRTYDHDVIIHAPGSEIIDRLLQHPEDLTTQYIHRSLWGGIVTPVLGVLHYVAHESGKRQSVLDMVNGSTDPKIRAFCQPLIETGFLKVEGKTLLVASEDGKRLLKAASAAHLLFSYLGLFLHENDIASNRMAYGLDPIPNKKMVYRWQPHNAIASGGLLSVRVVPRVSEWIIQNTIKRGIKDPHVIDFGSGDLRLLSTTAAMGKSPQYNLSISFAGVDIDRNTQSPAEANLQHLNGMGHWEHGDMTKPEDVERIIAKYPGTLVATMTHYIPHDIRGQMPGSDRKFFQAVRKYASHAPLILSESYRLTAEEYRKDPGATRWFWLIHEKTPQNLYRREKLLQVLSDDGYRVSEEMVHSKLADGTVANSTLIAYPK